MQTKQRGVNALVNDKINTALASAFRLLDHDAFQLWNKRFPKKTKPNP